MITRYFIRSGELYLSGEAPYTLVERGQADLYTAETLEHLDLGCAAETPTAQEWHRWASRKGGRSKSAKKIEQAKRNLVNKQQKET